MKDSNFKYVLEANELASHCGELKLWSHTPSTRDYSCAYRDFSTILKYVKSIIANVDILNGWEKCYKKFKNDPDADLESIQYSVQETKNQIESDLKNLREYVEERDNVGWVSM